MLELLITRSKSDKDKTVREAAQNSLQLIISKYNKLLAPAIRQLSKSEKEYIRNLMNLEEAEPEIQEEAAIGPKVPIAINNLAFGLVPISVIDHLVEKSEWKMKLKAI